MKINIRPREIRLFVAVSALIVFAVSTSETHGGAGAKCCGVETSTITVTFVDNYTKNISLLEVIGKPNIVVVILDTRTKNLPTIKQTMKNGQSWEQKLEGGILFAYMVYEVDFSSIFTEKPGKLIETGTFMDNTTITIE
jgi:hypothetical protein